MSEFQPKNVGSYPVMFNNVGFLSYKMTLWRY